MVLDVVQLAPCKRVMVTVLESHIPIDDPGAQDDNIRLDGARWVDKKPRAEPAIMTHG